LFDVENDMKKIGVRGWRKIDRDTDAWNLIPKEARVLHGAYSQRRRRGISKGHFVGKVQPT
jgi:hypothetical protein